MNEDDDFRGLLAEGEKGQKEVGKGGGNPERARPLTPGKHRFGEGVVLGGIHPREGIPPAGVHSEVESVGHEEGDQDDPRGPLQRTSLGQNLGHSRKGLGDARENLRPPRRRRDPVP